MDQDGRKSSGGRRRGTTRMTSRSIRTRTARGVRFMEREVGTERRSRRPRRAVGALCASTLVLGLLVGVPLVPGSVSGSGVAAAGDPPPRIVAPTGPDAPAHGAAPLPPGAPNNETHHPWRQGLSSAILGEGNPLNILGAIPTVAYGMFSSPEAFFLSVAYPAWYSTFVLLRLTLLG